MRNELLLVSGVPNSLGTGWFDGALDLKTIFKRFVSISVNFDALINGWMG